MQNLRRSTIAFKKVVLPALVAVTIVAMAVTLLFLRSQAGPVGTSVAAAATNEGGARQPVGAPADLAAKSTAYCNDASRSAVDVVRTALVLHQRFTVPTSGDLAEQMSQNAASALAIDNDSRVDSLYTVSAAPAVKQNYRDAEKAAASSVNLRALGGGVAEFQCTSAVTSGASTEVKANVVLWASMANARSDGSLQFAQPVNKMQVDAKLVDSSSGPLVDTLDLAFASGSGP